jgi:hypothetical protein
MTKPIPARLRPFGRRYISIVSLNKNKLALTTAGKMVCLRYELISDDLRDIIKAILRGDSLESLTDSVDDLSIGDRKILSKCFQEAQITHPFDLERDCSKNKIIHRFNVLRDEILIGNDSPELIQEFSELIDMLYEQKILSRVDYTRLKELCQV